LGDKQSTLSILIVMHIGNVPDSSVSTHRDDNRTMLPIFGWGFVVDSSSFCILINREKIK